MNEVIKVTVNDNHEPIVSGRQLHEALGVNSNYTTWFDRMTDYGFTENEDYVLLSNFGNQTGRGGHNKVDHIIKLDMAKEIAMIQRTDKGKEVRQYFIQVEKDFNSPEKIMARALLMADKKIHKLEMQTAQVTRLSWSETLPNSSAKTATKSEAIVFLSGCVKMAT